MLDNELKDSRDRKPWSPGRFAWAGAGIVLIGGVLVARVGVSSAEPPDGGGWTVVHLRTERVAPATPSDRGSLQTRGTERVETLPESKRAILEAGRAAVAEARRRDALSTAVPAGDSKDEIERSKRAAVADLPAVSDEVRASYPDAERKESH
ncbi:MAG: hypothetical protein R3E12_15050 [Candidatus Eisenbacteria bacterium]|uniref:Uncharacterized protein n=1 Tax=Eiseniibacteriota bacterium TaxID=2212470 RepID=A0A956LX42_UNCEI|nr:hypothetical protein [Candidatus Eisenbacteria bacterium]